VGSVGGVVGSVLLGVVGSVVGPLVGELLVGSVVAVVAVVVEVLARRVVVGAALEGVVEVERRVRGRVNDGGSLVDGNSLTAPVELRWGAAMAVVAGCGSASACCRGVVTNPMMLPPIAPISTAAMTEVQRLDSTYRIGLKTGCPPGRASLTR